MPGKNHETRDKELLRDINANERRVIRPGTFDWRHVKGQPFTRLLHNPSTRYGVEVKPERLSPGDLILMYWNFWQLVVATGEEIGYRKVYCSSESRNSRLSFERTAAPNYRLAQKLPIEIPEVTERITAQEENDLSPYLVELPTAEEVANFQYTVTEKASKVADKPYSLRKIRSLDEVFFDKEDGQLIHDYLYTTQKGTPIILSDFHQKLPLHIGLMVAMELIPNVKPVVDWVDEHDDSDTNYGIDALGHDCYTLDALRTITSQAWCGQAASMLFYSQLARLRAFEGMTIQDAPTGANVINPLNYLDAFARPSTNQPHILSFDLDQVPNYANIVVSSTYPRSAICLEEKTTSSYFDWLKKSGMHSDSYDAVCIYTSPLYIQKKIAHDAMKRVVALFE